MCVWLSVSVCMYVYMHTCVPVFVWYEYMCAYFVTDAYYFTLHKAEYTHTHLHKEHVGNDRHASTLCVKLANTHFLHTEGLTHPAFTLPLPSPSQSTVLQTECHNVSAIVLALSAQAQVLSPLFQVKAVKPTSILLSPPKVIHSHLLVSVIFLKQSAKYLIFLLKKIERLLIARR